MNPSHAPRILTTTVGSYPVPDWLAALPSEQALLDATRVVFNLQRQAGIDLPTDGELYRFDVNHPDTNGMIEYFVHKFGGVRREVGRRDTAAFRARKDIRLTIVSLCDKLRQMRDIGCAAIPNPARQCVPRERAGFRLRRHPRPPLRKRPTWPHPRHRSA